jgi:hypothetical protein
MLQAKEKGEAVSIAFEGNIVDLWERLAEEIFRLTWVPIRPHFIIRMPEVIIRQV